MRKLILTALAVLLVLTAAYPADAALPQKTAHRAAARHADSLGLWWYLNWTPGRVERPWTAGSPLPDGWYEWVERAGQRRSPSTIDFDATVTEYFDDTLTAQTTPVVIRVTDRRGTWAARHGFPAFEARQVGRVAWRPAPWLLDPPHL